MTDTQQKKRQSQTSRQNEAPQDAELRNILVKGEEVILRARFHGAIYWKSVAVLILSVFFALLFIREIGVILGIFGALMLCASILTKHYLMLVITNKRVLARYGILQMDVVDIRLSKVESIDLERMLPGHVFGYSNVVVMGTGQRMLRVPYIANADAFRRFYNEMVLIEEGNEEAEEEIQTLKEQAVKQKKSSKDKK